MRKCTTIVILCFLGIVILSDKKDKDRAGFDIYKSISFESGGYNSTTISVIVYERDYETGSLFEEIKLFHNKLNGESDELEINLYNKDDLKEYKCIESKIYYK